MPEHKQTHPRLITLMIVLLLLQGPVLLFLALNLLTEHWSFLFSWPVFITELERAFSLVVSTPGELVEDAILFYNMVAFGILSVAAVIAVFSGLTIRRGGALSWIMGLIAQIATLMTAIWLYMIYKPAQAFWLMGIGILMVLYLNNADVRQWLLRHNGLSDGDDHA